MAPGPRLIACQRMKMSLSASLDVTKNRDESQLVRGRFNSGGRTTRSVEHRSGNLRVSDSSPVRLYISLAL